MGVPAASLFLTLCSLVPGTAGAQRLAILPELSWSEQDKSIWITGLVDILGLCALAVYLQFSRRQLRQARDAQTRLSGLLISAQEKERTRLAAELHLVSQG